ncbi:MAG: cbb3-type cytochrome c oxidase subunit I [Planctomycetota bacterium]|jgi:cytochrome c oxidase subunit 1|nr:cbb3-type cytochrome c oxidase subunit I [Planctomycetota bacterium]MDP6764204.1 cbb3-type cytochrome c oxidase subunit I [Planctomycetota bacterium]MDP6988293.1 cbb3-type cytochrome c oxidase subunit I [Planctomycetota bacterium]
MAVAQEHAPQSFVSKYVFSTDHKMIGLQYILTALFMGIVGSALAVLIRTQITWPEKALVTPESYISLVTMHGTIMVFFVVSLALVSGFGNFLIPLMLGARDMAYPFLNMLSYWTVVPGCILILASFLVEGGAAAAGWTAYPPLSALPEAVPGSGLGQTLWLLAMALFIASFTMGGLNYIATILNCRARGMSLMRMPLTVWTYFMSAILGVLAFPPLTAAAIMLLLDRHGGTSFFLPGGLVFGNETLPHEGGTPLLFQHLFWFLGHPEVYVLVLPGIGITFDILATFARRPIFGYKTSVWALIVVGFLSMIVWGHHMYVTGMNPYVGEYFSIATVLITAPFAVLGLNLVASLWRSRIRMEVPMYWALGTIAVIGLGGFGGLFLATSISDIYFHESFFVVGHFHLMIGVVTVLSTLGGLYHWFPKMFGRKMNAGLARLHFWTTYVPIVAVFALMHFQGLSGLLRRYYDHTIYDFQSPGIALALPITVLSYVVTASQLVFVYNFFVSMKRGEQASDNPWNATTLEWTTPSPAPHGNWPGALPVVDRHPYDYDPSAPAEGDFKPQGTVA